MIDLFLKGLVIGFCIAAPVGPIGILCINRSLHGGFKSGFFTGCGAATADGVYGLIAGLGLTTMALFCCICRFRIGYVSCCLFKRLAISMWCYCWFIELVANTDIFCGKYTASSHECFMVKIDCLFIRLYFNDVWLVCVNQCNQTNVIFKNKD